MRIANICQSLNHKCHLTRPDTTEGGNADEIHTAERHRTKLRDYQIDEPSDVRWSRLDRIFDTLYFGPSKHSRLLQAADLLTYIYLRRATVKETSPRAAMANERIWNPIAPRIVAETMYPDYAGNLT